MQDHPHFGHQTFRTNPVDYKVWSVMQEKVYQQRIKDVDELRECIRAAWDELDQRIIDTAVRQWRTRLHACVYCLLQKVTKYYLTGSGNYGTPCISISYRIWKVHIDPSLVCLPAKHWQLLGYAVIAAVLCCFCLNSQSVQSYNGLCSCHASMVMLALCAYSIDQPPQDGWWSTRGVEGDRVRPARCVNVHIAVCSSRKPLWRRCSVRCQQDDRFSRWCCLFCIVHASN